jgi:hypothetical protein
MKHSLRVFSFLVLGLASIVGLLAQESREVHKSGPFSKDGRLFVDTYKGTVEVTTWDKPEIDITARIEAEGSDRRSRESVQDTEVRIDLSSNSARVKTDYDRVRRHHDGFFGLFSFESDDLPMVHYKIRVPRKANVEVKDYKSKTFISDLESDIVIDSYKGDIEIKRLSGSLDLKTYKGKARVDVTNLEGRSRIETYKGETEVSLPKGKGFDLDAEIGKGARLRSDFELEKDGSRKRNKGYDIRVAVNGGGPVVRLKCDKGTVRLLER